MNTIQDEIKRFERIQQEIAILGFAGIHSLEMSRRLFEDLQALELDSNGKPKLSLIKGGRYES